MNDIRNIENPFAKIFNVVNPDSTQLYNLLLKLLKQFFHDVKLPSVICIASKPSKSSQDPTAYVGTAGYLCMLLRLHDYFSIKQVRASEVFASKAHLVGDQGVSKLTDPSFYLQLAQEQYEVLQKYTLSKKRAKDCFSFFMSEVSVWLYGMHIAYKTKNLALFRQNENRILENFQSLKTHLNQQFWQLLYGVPGFLFVIVQLQKHYDKECEIYRTNFAPIAVELTHLIIKQGIINYQNLTKTKINLDKLPQDFRLVFDFHKKQYLGGAHGLGGNINIILTAMKFNDFGAETMNIVNLLKVSITFLLKHLINGNFAVKANSKSINLVHFCHGAPGIVTALAKFTQMFPEIGVSLGLKEVIEVNLNHIWKYGVLKKGFGLCHGISGNAYAFISPSLQQVFHDRVGEYLKKAQFFALLHEEPDVMKEIRQYGFEDRMVVGKSDQPYSLMLGIAGDICFTVDVLNGSGYFPGYDN